MKLVTRDIVREIDRRTIEDYGIPGLILMENAGRTTAEVIMVEFPEAQRIAVFTGSGNNAGDGFVIARQLISAGLEVTTYLAGNPRKLAGDALTNYNALKKTGADLKRLDKGFGAYAPSDLVVDALFGTGLDRPVRGFLKEVIVFINSLEVPRVAVDLPSGLDADTGQPLGAAVMADVTVTFILPKLGLATHPGVAYAGKVYVADITSPKFLEDGIPYELITFDTVRSFYGPRDEDTHKGTYGHLAVLAGSPGKTGAAMLAARGALKSGTGLVTVGVPEGLNPVFEAAMIEPMTMPLPETDEGSLGPEAVGLALEMLSEGRTALAIGPGISTTERTRRFFKEVLLSCPVPVVIDADGLTILAEEPALLRKLKAPCVITPHPGEMGRLMGKSSREVQGARVEIAGNFAEKYNAYVVLKGARTVVASPDGGIFINPTGNAGMASAGMGDVLTGVVAGFLAQGLGPLEAALLGVFAHGLAGDIFKRTEG